MDIEDALPGILQSGQHRVEARLKQLLALLAIRVPGGDVAPAGADHLVILIQLNHHAFDQLNLFGRPHQVIQLEHVIVARRDVAADPGPGQFLVGVGQPLPRVLQHFRMENLVDAVGMRAQFGDFVRRGAVGIVAAAGDLLGHVIHFGLAVQHEVLLQQDRLPGLAALVDDRDDGLARHVAAQDQHLGLVKLPGTDELFPADVRAVNVRRKENSRHHALLWRPGGG